MEKLKVLDLFSGCGGLSIGLEQSGFKTLWANEMWSPAASTFKTLHADAKMFEGDANIFLEKIRDKEKKTPQKGDVDLLVGGPPCQGFCGINRYRKFNDPRNSLIDTFFDFVEVLLPPLVLMENVTGMLSLNKGEAAKNLLNSFEEIGYSTNMAILQAGCYGLPQNRWRVFIFAVKKGISLPDIPNPIHTFPPTPAFDTKEFKNKVIKPPKIEQNLFHEVLPHTTVGDAIRDLPPIENGGEYEGPYISEPNSEYQRTLRINCKSVTDHSVPKLAQVNMDRVKNLPKRPGACWKDLPEKLKPKNLVRAVNHSYTNRFGRLDWNGTFTTILTKPEPYWGRVIHPTQDRVISAREAARAQGFPDTVTFQGRKLEKYKQIGNSVPPPLAKALGNTIRDSLIKSRSKKK